MNKKRMMAVLMACLAASVSVSAVTAHAAEDYIYGTMNIPYAEFYANEGVGTEVDVVASATTSGKWKNENLVAGTYHEDNGDETGTILGVTYPVALTEDTLSALGENDYGFVQTEGTPDAYKIVTVEGGTVSFSEVQGETSAVTGVSASITTDTPWGDYQVTVDEIHNSEGTSDMGRIYGVLVDTEEGDRYALRHLENIWRDSLAWSTGITTSEPHGNTLSYENFVDMMGQTIRTITYITDTGYHTLDTDLYLPVKFENTVSVSDAAAADGKTSFEMTGFPEDYSKAYSIEGLDCTVTDGEIAYTGAAPGSYTLVIQDQSGVYAETSADFVLSTDQMPAVYADGKLSKAADADDAAFANFMKNLATVSVNGQEYAASGRGSVAIISEDGTIDMEAASRDTKVFDGSGSYEMTVSATGYTETLSFTLGGEDTGIEDAPNTGVRSAALPGLAVSSALAAWLIAKKRKETPEG